MALNAAGLDVRGDKNPNWRGGLIEKKCTVCQKKYSVKTANKSSKFCSMQCTGISQRGIKRPAKNRESKNCVVCDLEFSLPKSMIKRKKCCSRECSNKYRSKIMSGENNPRWSNGSSRLPYPYNFSKSTSKEIIARDNNLCRGPFCSGKDKRLTAHHINYNKQDCSSKNLICLCSACNSSANTWREWWEFYYNCFV